MKNNNTYILSSKCLFKELNQEKQNQLNTLVDEYHYLLNIYINHLWNLFLNDNSIRMKSQFVIQDYPITNTNLSARIKCSCINQASSIVRSRIEQIKEFKSKTYKENNQKHILRLQKLFLCPEPKKKSLHIDTKTSKIDLSPSIKYFDIALTLSSLGICKKFSLLLKKHKHFNKLSLNSKLLGGIILTKEGVQFQFEFQKEDNINTDKIGIDIGVVNLCSTSKGDILKYNDKGKSYHKILQELSNKNIGSVSFRKKSEERKNCINFCINRLNLDKIKQVNIEGIKELRYRRKISRLLKGWNYKDIFDKIQSYCLKQNVSVLSIFHSYTSQRCYSCGYVHKSNRKLETFKCKKCNYADNSDLNASKNICIANELTSIPKDIKMNKYNRTCGFYWLNDKCIINK